MVADIVMTIGRSCGRFPYWITATFLYQQESSQISTLEVLPANTCMTTATPASILHNVVWLKQLRLRPNPCSAPGPWLKKPNVSQRSLCSYQLLDLQHFYSICDTACYEADEGEIDMQCTVDNNVLPEWTSPCLLKGIHVQLWHISNCISDYLRQCG